MRHPGFCIASILALWSALPVSAGENPLNTDKLVDRDRILTPGRFYEATVPDTLDLAAHARLSINALTGNVEPKTFYGVYQGFQFDADPPKPQALTWNITPKNARTLPMLRAITGSDLGLDTEAGMMRALLRQVRPDGQMYYPFDGSGPPKGTSYPQINALVIFAMLNWYERDGNPAWLDAVDLLAKGLRQTAIQVEDRAYYPMQSGITPKGKWLFMLGGETLPIAYKPPDEPVSDQQGLEGAAKSDQVRPLSALAKHYRRTGDKKSLEMAQKLARFCLKRGLWEKDAPDGSPGNEHAVWGGHFHNNTLCLMALFDLALAEQSGWLKQFVREGYDHGRHNGVVRLGWFPAWTNPTRYNRPDWLQGVTEPCAVADMAVLGVKLSDAGLGDYWDDVDAIVRNHLVAQQITDLDRMRKVAGGKPDNDGLRRQFLGGFACGNPTVIQLNTLAGCCTANGAQGICYAWHGITRFEDGVATVNLFLNRAAPWVDVDSYLPYEGKVVLHNKQAHTALVRIPGWVDQAKVSCFVNDKPVRPTRTGRYLLVQHLKPGEEVRLEFPVPVQTDKYTIHGKEYTVTFRGSTVVEITPQDADPKKYHLYPREGLKADKAPLHKVKRFVAEKVFPLGTF
jgi:hypothetical protein